MCPCCFTSLLDVFQAVLLYESPFLPIQFLFDLQDSAQASFLQEAFPGLTRKIQTKYPLLCNVIMILSTNHNTSKLSFPVASTKGHLALYVLASPGTRSGPPYNRGSNKCLLIWTESPRDLHHQVSLARDKSGPDHQRAMEVKLSRIKSHYYWTGMATWITRSSECSWPLVKVSQPQNISGCDRYRSKQSLGVSGRKDSDYLLPFEQQI